jgi:hypothetical protein
MMHQQQPVRTVRTITLGQRGRGIETTSGWRLSFEDSFDVIAIAPQRVILRAKRLQYGQEPLTLLLWPMEGKQGLCYISLARGATPFAVRLPRIPFLYKLLGLQP